MSKPSPKFTVDIIGPLQRYNNLRILCDEDVDINDFMLAKSMPEDIINGLNELLLFLEKYGLESYIDTIEKLIQHLSQSDIKLEYLQGITYVPRKE